MLVCLLFPLALAACGAEPVWAPDAAVSAASYSSGEPPSVTLFTVISTRTGGGGHSALMIDGRQRVMFDPAGTWYHPYVPERNDVHYGITPRMRAFYIDYHARETFFVREQRVPVSLEVAEIMRARAEANGAAPKAFCANAVGDVLRATPGFESMPGGFSPLRISKAFAELPGATLKDHYDGDPDNNSGVLMIEAKKAEELGIVAPNGHRQGSRVE
ncbi:hypothetical protein [Phaeovulum veldkampii]|uniref:hypothetical protein n=1 Tax=Phaeovulum veldkampii TaxID=33049 RepID=UPI001F45BD4F|nr:hypothetical protein [Phaeovulum veldkampii]